MIEIITFVATIVVILVSYLANRNLHILDRFFYSIEEKSNHHGGELVAQVLKAHDIKFIFTLCGGHISPILVAAEKLNIRIIDVRHEVTAVFAADSVARLSGKIGVAAVTAGPGLTNTVTAVKNAQMAESPILLIGGAAAGLLKGRGALQDIDQMALFKPLCKYTATVSRIRDIVPTVREAIRVAQSGTPGPVFVEFPIDTLYPYHMVKREIGVTSSPTSLIQRITNLYLNAYIFNLFAGGFSVHHDVSPLPVSIPEPSNRKIRQAVNLLLKAKRPLMLLGSQATLPPIPAEIISQTVKKLGIPCYLGGMSRGLLGRFSSIQFRQCRREALKQADVIILAGAVADFRLSYGRVFNRKAYIIAINRDEAQLYKNSDLFWKPAVAIKADIGTTLTRILESLDSYNVDSNWLMELQNREDDKENANREKARAPTEVHLNPLKILESLENTGLGDRDLLVADGGDFVGSAAYILRPRGPLKWLDPGAFGTLGVGGGFALGAKLCRPEENVWVVYGDGSVGYSIAEFDTFVRHQVPVIALVGNDACWSQISREQVPTFGSNVGCALEYTRYDVVAEGYGGRGFLLDRNNDSDSSLSALFQEARNLASQGHPVLINAMIGKTNFREGSISV